MSRGRRAAALAALLALAPLGPARGATPPPADLDTPTPPCFGAAARDAAHPCRNPALRLVVTPTPIQALTRRGAPCAPLPLVGLVESCAFGDTGPGRRGEVALLGDSHAGHWRAAVTYVARAHGWRATQITRSGCAFSTAARSQPEPERGRCRAWNRQVVAWFRAHPEVHVVFTSANVATSVVVPRGGSARAVLAAGFRRAWASLPPSVTRVVVLRDVLRRPLATLDCVEAAMAARRPAGAACARPRSYLLLPDAQVRAARAGTDPRVALADLSRFSCSTRQCFPVVGGVLVNKDASHMTTTFSLSLGPYLLERVAQLGPYAEDAPHA